MVSGSSGVFALALFFFGFIVLFAMFAMPFLGVRAVLFPSARPSVRVELDAVIGLRRRSGIAAGHLVRAA